MEAAWISIGKEEKKKRGGLGVRYVEKARTLHVAKFEVAQ